LAGPEGVETMTKKEEENRSDTFSLPFPSSEDLRGRQSVRATFKLTEKAIDALSVVSIHLGIKQKSLFDHLMEDLETLNSVTQEIHLRKADSTNRVQKTYVLSRRTLLCLDRTSKALETPRDALVEYSIQRLLPLIEMEREKHRNRKKILNNLTAFVRHGEKILEESHQLLGEEDPVHDKLASALNTFSNACAQIQSFVEKGEIIEHF
jgi:hypothetical protein